MRPTAQMSPKLIVEKLGYAFLPSFYPELGPMEIAVALGLPEEVAGLRLIQELLPTTPDLTTPNTYSGNFGLGAFPLHTDLAHWGKPPQYLMLRCERGDPEAETRLVDGRTIVASLGPSALARCLARPRRPISGTFQLLPIWQASSERSQQRIQWDSIYLKPANAYAQTTFRRIEESLSHAEPITKVLLNKGDTLLLDNWRVLHGRSPVRSSASLRKIHRMYLSSLA
jgi:L-asparagine oxygenase